MGCALASAEPLTPVKLDGPRATSELEEVRRVFKRFDVNSDGTIDRSELCNILQQLDAKTWDSARVSRLLATIDVNHDQRIQLDEFCDYLFLSDPSFHKHRFVGALIGVSPEVSQVFPAGGTVKSPVKSSFSNS